MATNTDVLSTDASLPHAVVCGTPPPSPAVQVFEEKHPGMLHIPETLADWPWPRRLNPHYDEVGQQSRAWLRSLHAFPVRVQAAFDACDFNLLASLAYPRHSKSHVRIACDVMNVFFVIEEYTDDASVEDTAKVADMVMDALRNPHTPRRADEMQTCLAGEIARQFWANAVRTASQTAQARFVAAFDAYTQSVVREAADRSSTHGAARRTTHTVDSYLALRRKTIGCWPSFALLGLDTEHLTDRALGHPLVDALGHLATELILIGNDLVSYNRERKDGALHNLVAIVLRSPPSTHSAIATPQQAVDWIAQYHDVLAKHFLRVDAAVKAMLGPGSVTPPVGAVGAVGSPVSPVSPVDAVEAALTEDEKAAMREYIDGLGNWVRANDQWSFESLRYFGKDGAQVQKVRLVELRPLGG